MGQFIQSPTHSTTNNVVRVIVAEQLNDTAQMDCGTKGAILDTPTASVPSLPLLLVAFDRGFNGRINPDQ